MWLKATTAYAYASRCRQSGRSKAFFLSHSDTCHFFIFAYASASILVPSTRLSGLRHGLRKVAQPIGYIDTALTPADCELLPSPTGEAEYRRICKRIFQNGPVEISSHCWTNIHLKFKVHLHSIRRDGRPLTLYRRVKISEYRFSPDTKIHWYKSWYFCWSVVCTPDPLWSPSGICTHLAG